MENSMKAGIIQGLIGSLYNSGIERCTSNRPRIYVGKYLTPYITCPPTDIEAYNGPLFKSMLIRKWWSGVTTKGSVRTMLRNSKINAQ